MHIIHTQMHVFIIFLITVINNFFFFVQILTSSKQKHRSQFSKEILVNWARQGDQKELTMGCKAYSLGRSVKGISDSSLFRE